MIHKFCKIHAFKEGCDYKIFEKGSITYLYFTELPKAKYLRAKLSNSAVLKEIDLGVISKIICRKEPYGYFFFVSQERVM